MFVRNSLYNVLNKSGLQRGLKLVNFSNFHTTRPTFLLGKGIGRKSKPSRLNSLDQAEPLEIKDELGYEREKERLRKTNENHILYEESLDDPELRRELLKKELEATEYKPLDVEKKYPFFTWILGQGFFGQWITGTFLCLLFAGGFLVINKITGNDDLVMNTHNLFKKTDSTDAKMNVEETGKEIALRASKKRDYVHPSTLHLPDDPDAPELVATSITRYIISNAFKAANIPYAEYVGKGHFLIYLPPGRSLQPVLNRIKSDNPQLKTFTYDIIEDARL